MGAVSYLSIASSPLKVKCLPVTVIVLTSKPFLFSLPSTSIKATINSGKTFKDAKFLQSDAFCDDCAVVCLNHS